MKLHRREAKLDLQKPPLNEFRAKNKKYNGHEADQDLSRPVSQQKMK